MRHLVAVTTLAVAAAVWAGQSATAPSRAAGCTPGVKKLEGEDVRVFCGPARATVKFAGKTYHFKNGLCQKTPGTGVAAFAVNIGTLEIPTPLSPKTSYFGVLLDKAKGGTYRNQLVAASVPGRNLGTDVDKVVVSSNLKKGSYKGATLVYVKGSPIPKKVPISGSWTC